jgi:outer membrane receptor for ferrienterochelin and colicin
MHIRNLFRLLFTTAVLLGWAASSVLAQGVTTSGVGGTVTDEQGRALSGVSVTITHVPSGTRVHTTTHADGQYSAAGLRVGGPYTITAAPQGQAGTSQENIYLELGQTSEVNVQLKSEIVTLDKYDVTASRDTTFGSGKMGTVSSFDESSISNTATVRNSVQDVARLDTRMYLGSLDQGGQLSAQGQNFRFNTFLVDGVAAGDPFGLNSNGFSSLRSPVPLEALSTISVQLEPYDVRYAGFTGAVINAIVKSGTNEFHGSAYYQFTNEDMRAKNPVSGVKEPFDEKQYGLTVAGPIIKDRLFFSFTYDMFKRDAVAPQPNFVPDAAGQAQVNAVIARAKALGYDAGTLSGPGSNSAQQETYIGKIDWNISDQHRLSVTYRRNHGFDTSFAKYTDNTATSLSNYWFDQPRNTDSYTAQLNSQWTPDFRTEALVSYTEYDGTPTNRGKSFPQVEVRGISGKRMDTGATITSGSVYLGTESSRQLNLITTKETQGKLSAEYVLGDHTITFGAEEISTKYNNAYVQYTYGSYSFVNPDAWAAGSPVNGYTLQRPYAGHTLDEAVARWKYDAYALFIQDTWRINSKLNLLGGLRYDYPYIGERPPYMAAFGAAGFTAEDGRPVVRNNTTNSGNATLAPRVGFTYDFGTKRKTQLRGGVGLFQGKNPAVWISNAYSNAGAVYTYTPSGANLAATVFNPDPNTQAPVGSSNPAPSINITDPNFKQPSLWKTNLALDHELPFGGLTVSAEYYYQFVEEGMAVQFLNYAVATDGPATTPDGRTRFGPANAIVAGSSALSGTPGRRRVSNFADVYYLTNTNKGTSDGITLSVRRPMKNNWSWSASWTRGHATEVSPVTSSVAGSNYQYRAVFNPNEDIASRSNTDIKDNIVVQIARKFNLIPHAPTTVSVVYQGRSGHPYSWTFYGDANGDGFTFNDLVYVPTGPSDPKVTWASTTERDAFFDLVEKTSLKKYKGTHPGRNSETSPWLNTIDLHVTQEIPIFKRVKAEVYASVLNIANWFDDSWGIQEEIPFSYRRSVVGATYDKAGNGGQGAWKYTFTGTTYSGIPVTANEHPVSRWQAELGMRIKF